MADQRVVLSGCDAQALIGYLKALGVFRAVTRQADPSARGCWSGSRFVLESTLDADDLIAFFVERYAPAPIVSPWNNGSGFYPGKKTASPDALAAIRKAAASEPRMLPMAQAIAAGEAATLRDDSGDLVKPGGGENASAVRQRLRARAPDAVIEWLDAVVSFDAEKSDFAPLLGAGGGDGNSDLAGNYAQALELLFCAPPGRRTVSPEALCRASLLAAAVQLGADINFGQLWRDRSPRMSPQDEVDDVVDPWDLVLGLEGCLVLSGALGRRLSGLRGGLSAPFTAKPTAAGYGSAVVGEKGRSAELWLPIWSTPCAFSEYEGLVREGRAQVGRRSAVSGLDYSRAVGSLGVARGINAFQRFALVQRIGQANIAVPTGSIAVHRRSGPPALQTIDGWLNSVLRFGASDKCPSGPSVTISALRVAAYDLAAASTPTSAQRALAALGATEVALARSGSSLPEWLRPPRRAAAGPWLEAADDGSAEFALAVAIGSLANPAALKLPSMRDYLTGTGRDGKGRRCYQPERVPPIRRSAQPVQQLAEIHARRHLDAESAQAAADSDPWAIHFQYGRPVPPDAARRLAAGTVDLKRILDLARGLALLDYRGVSWHGREDESTPPVPAFDLLAAAWAPLRAEDEAVERLPRTGWAEMLRRDRAPAVIAQAHLRLRLAGLDPIADPGDLMAAAPPGPRLAAALLPRLSSDSRKRITRAICLPPTHDEGAVP